ncbi:MAG: glycosyltransferase [Chloroflexota bacterium]
MERPARAGAATPGAFTAEATAGLRGLPADGDPVVLGYYPSLTTNPFQALLYQQVREHAIAPVRLRSEDQLAELEALQASGIRTVLHLHWLHPVLRGATSVEDARARSDDFLRRIDSYRASGGFLVWTVHNILPHEARFEAEEGELGAAVAARSDLIHVLAARTAELVGPLYPLPLDRIVHVPHPNYSGVYPDHVSRLDARHELGLRPDELVYLVLGAIRPYKGLAELLDAWDEMPDDRPRRLVIAGFPTDELGVASILERAALHPTVVLDARKIPAQEMQVFLRAADVAVLPYRRALNSGALMLALTFGVPAIVPRPSGLTDLVDEHFSRTFDGDDPSAMAQVLRDAAVLATPVARAAAAAAAAAVPPPDVSHRYALALREMLATTIS